MVVLEAEIRMVDCLGWVSVLVRGGFGCVFGLAFWVAWSCRRVLNVSKDEVLSGGVGKE